MLSNRIADGTNSSVKLYTDVTTSTPLNRPEVTIYNTTQHNLKNGESIRIFSEDGDLPEGLEENKVYYAITAERNPGQAMEDQIMFLSLVHRFKLHLLLQMQNHKLPSIFQLMVVLS